MFDSNRRKPPPPEQQMFFFLNMHNTSVTIHDCAVTFVLFLSLSAERAESDKHTGSIFVFGMLEPCTSVFFQHRGLSLESLGVGPVSGGWGRGVAGT